MNVGYIDGENYTAKFNKLQGCTQFGKYLAVADEGNTAIRLINMITYTVSTLIQAVGTADGIFDSSLQSSGQVSSVTFLNAVNNRQLLVAGRSDPNQSVRILYVHREIDNRIKTVYTDTASFPVSLSHHPCKHHNKKCILAFYIV